MEPTQVLTIQLPTATPSSSSGGPELAYGDFQRVHHIFQQPQVHPQVQFQNDISHQMVYLRTQDLGPDEYVLSTASAAPFATSYLVNGDRWYSHHPHHVPHALSGTSYRILDSPSCAPSDYVNHLSSQNSGHTNSSGEVSGSSQTRGGPGHTQELSDLGHAIASCCTVSGTAGDFTIFTPLRTVSEAGDTLDVELGRGSGGSGSIYLTPRGSKNDENLLSRPIYSGTSILDQSQLQYVGECDEGGTVETTTGPVTSHQLNFFTEDEQVIQVAETETVITASSPDEVCVANTRPRRARKQATQTKKPQVRKPRRDSGNSDCSAEGDWNKKQKSITRDRARRHMTNVCLEMMRCLVPDLSETIGFSKVETLNKTLQFLSSAAATEFQFRSSSSTSSAASHSGDQGDLSLNSNDSMGTTIQEACEY